jgi:ribosomal protein S6 kinase alpha-5
VIRKCRHRKTGQQYAVKILSRHKYDSTREIKYLSKCQGHENIVKLYDVLQDDLHTYIIMELLTGGELFDRLRKRHLFTEREASALMKSLISAIQYMHSQGVVHRDLKPENILFSDTSDTAKVKIVDFGFARAKPDPKLNNNNNNNVNTRLNSNNSNTNTVKKNNNNNNTGMMQTPCFTLSYAAPEVLRQALFTTTTTTTATVTSTTTTTTTNGVEVKGTKEDTASTIEPGQGYDESCDLWSLGVILYTILCGSVPFSSNSNASIDR